MLENEDGINKKRIIEASREFGLPKAVVAPELIEETVPLREAWLGTLRDKRDISHAIKYATKVLPGMSHLKRCSGKRLILAFAAPIDGAPSDPERCLSRQQLEDLLCSGDCTKRSLFEEELEIVGVPAGPPKTKAQARMASKIWPINFHPDPYIESTLDGSCFDFDNLAIIDRCMKLCIEAAAREAYGNDECNGSAIIFDPIAREIVALAASRINRHPLWHAAMLAVDLVARLGNGRIGGGGGGGGGVYEFNDEFVNRKRKYLNRKEEPPLVYPDTLLEIIRRESLPPLLAGGSDKTIGRRAGGNSAYLCTNYWVFLLREPCAMCAMALVHSRVSNIFYGATNDSRGVLGSRVLLHAIPALNHRYRVWRGIRENECNETCIVISRRR